jgi:Rrf2 family iron-sulfur cluster assembly transcriptional regulator
MIDLALRQNNGPVTLAAISQRQQISLSYLEQLFGKLRRHELVESTRGPGGGYTLAARPPTSPWPTSSCRWTSPSTPPSAAARKTAWAKRPLHDARAVGRAEPAHGRVSGFRHLQKLVDEQIAKGVQIEDKPVVRRAISTPVVKPIRVNAPNSVFALGNAFAKS